MQASKPQAPEGLGWCRAFLPSLGKWGHHPPNSNPGYKEGKRNFKSLWLPQSFTHSFPFWPHKAFRPTYLNTVSLYIKKITTKPLRPKPGIGQDPAKEPHCSQFSQQRQEKGLAMPGGAAPTFAASRPAASLQCLKPPGWERFNLQPY